ncbi:cytochrome P450 [Pseudomassariella vexata]|uniref:Cytochrome P450 n=1 Tax=Pseudomassariella vexata TaxID=1141098 RepID=A0A1Y2E7M3_9PEZI|nr:cytochrome P450 [Pseudomassariella vexata]ORY67568.1 cytochrome P450 [Pseudomassariella vexata]
MEGVSIFSALLASITFGSLAVFFIGASFSYGFYNAFLHPLSRYPGPLLMRAYMFPLIYQLCTGQIAHNLIAYHKKYGPVVRIGPDALSFISGKAWTDIYGLLPGRCQNLKDKHYFIPGMGGIILSDNSTHTQRRRMLMSSFSARFLEEIQPMLMKYVDLMMARLRERIDEDDTTQDIGKWYNWALVDFTGDFSFGQSFECLEKQDWHPWIKTVFDGITAGFAISQLERYGLYTFLRMVLPESAWKMKKDFDDFVQAVVHTRLEKGQGTKPDVFRNILLNSGGEELELQPLYHDSTSLIIAGSETTATLLTAATYYLLRAPEKQDRAVEEVRRMFQSDVDINMHSVNGLRYLIAVLQETLRIFPPIPGAMARVVSQPEGQMIEGNFVPYGTAVGVHQLAGSLSPRNWTRPDEFLPERWLPENKEEFEGDHHDASRAFSYGPRDCIGKNLAHIELRIIMAKLLLHFDMELPKEMEEWRSGCQPHIVWDKPPLMVKMKRARR